MKKFLIALAAALVLCVPAFAVDENYFCANSITSYYSYANTEAVAVNSDVYFCYMDYGSSGTRATLIALTFNEGAAVNITRSGSTTSYQVSGSSNNVDGTVVYYKPLSSEFDSANSTPSVHEYSLSGGYSTICSDFVSWYNTYATPSTPAAGSSFTLPRGNVLYFQVASEQDVHFTSYMDTLSNIINFNTAIYGSWGDTGQRYGEAAALPTAGTIFPLLSQSPIAWQKDSSTNILGQTKVGLATKHCIAGQWYCFYNPNANHVEGADPYNASPGASVVIQGSFSQIKVYPVNQKLSVVDGDLYSGSNDDFDSYYNGTIDQDGTITWTNQDGNIEAPAAGGQNFEDGPKSATSLLEGIRVTLETVVHELQTLFTFGYSAIQSLVGIMSDFVSVFSGLYTWLPAEVYSALMSAVVVAIVIGVFKVFL